MLVMTAAFTASAQTAPDDPIVGRQAEIAAIAHSLDEGSRDLAAARGRLLLLRDEARAAVERLTQERAAVQEQLTALGEPPADPAAEPADVTARRHELTTALDAATARLAQARLNLDDSSRLLGEISQSRRAAFYANTLKRDHGALAPALWLEAEAGAADLLDRLAIQARLWWAAQAASGWATADTAMVLGALLLALALIWPIGRWMEREFSNLLGARHPTGPGRYAALIGRLIQRVSPGVFGGFALLTAMEAAGLLTQAAHPAAAALWRAVIGYLLAEGLLLALFGRRAAWRIVPLSDWSAHGARWMGRVAALAVAADYVMTEVTALSERALELAEASSVLSALAIALVLLAAARGSAWRLDEARGDELTPAAAARWRRLRRLGAPLAIVVLAALGLGYLNLGHFLASRAAFAVGLILLVWIGRAGVLEGLKAFDAGLMSRHPEDSGPARKAMLFWAGLAVDLLLLMIVTPLALVLAGFDFVDVRAGLIDAYNGVTIGNITISLADFLSGLAVFFTIVLVTRFLQRQLDLRLFSGRSDDEGLRNSFRMLLGYAGLLLAVVLAVDTVGLDLSNLAIIAGALSVGLGFGLQSIVNNFVSGLILLFERPVKVGDWIVTGSGEGFVKRISVRSTEIETFDRASIIVPNSELISSSVQNWTLKDRGGRIIIAVGVGYGSDMERVREMLLEIAAKHPQVREDPAPYVYFKDFGESSLDLELRVFIANVDHGLRVRSDLRFAILAAFRENGVEIPFPQRDVHLREVKGTE